MVLLSSLSRIRFPEAVWSSKCSSWGLLLKVPDLHEDELLWVGLYWSKQTTHGGVNAEVTACQNRPNMDCLCLGRTLEVDGLLAFLDLRSAFEKSSAQENIGCEVSSNLCVILPGSEISCSVWFVQAQAIPDLFLSRFHRVFGNLCCVCETCFLFVFSPPSMSLNIDFILHLKSHGFVDPKNVWISVMIQISVCPEKFVLMKLYWSARDIVLVYEMSSGPILQTALSSTLCLPWRCHDPHTVQSLRIHVLLFSIDFLLVTPTERKVSWILFASFAIMKFHWILRQPSWDLEVWLAQTRWSSVFCEFYDRPEISWIFASFPQASKMLPTYNRSWT